MLVEREVFKNLIEIYFRNYFEIINEFQTFVTEANLF